MGRIGSSCQLRNSSFSKHTGDNKEVATTLSEDPETPVVPTTPAKPVPSDETPVGVTGNIIQNGDSLEKVAIRYGGNSKAT